MHRAGSSEVDASLPNLYLIGFMGTGKTSVGREVSKRLRMRFIDSDWAIEQEEGRTISEIFASDGEPYFRTLERRFIESGHPPCGCVVSCGGGLPLQPEMGELLRARGIVVCLFAPIETILARTAMNDRRPLLQAPDREARVRALMAEREPRYMKLGIGVFAGGEHVAGVVGNVLRVYRRERRNFASISDS
jgi:shikimate kinase